MSREGEHRACERELVVGIHDDVVELDARDLAQAVDELEASRLFPAETDRDGSEIRRAGRLELDPVQAVARVRLHDLEILAHVAVAAEQHRRARADGVVERRDRDLLELDVVNPELLAVGLHGVHLRAEGREVHAIGAGRGRREDRLTAVNFADYLPRVAVEDVIETSSGADVNVLADHRGRGDVIAVPRPAASGKPP